MATNTTLSTFRAGPFPIADVGGYGSKFLGIGDLANCATVSKPWNAFIKFLPVWAALHDVEKIPLIEGHGEEEIMKDYLFMSPRTYGAKNMACLGEFVGEVPKMSAAAFKKFKDEKDSYSPKKMRETWVVVVEPSAIRRPFDQVLLKSLMWEGDFTAPSADKIDSQEQDLLVPYSLKNLKILAEWPLPKRIRKTPIFKFVDPRILNQCSVVAKAVKMSLMCKKVPSKTVQMTYSDQKQYLKENGHAIVPLCTRTYFDVIEIHTHGDCPDHEGPLMTYTRTSNEVNSNHDRRPISIGGFDRDDGIEIRVSRGDACYYNGAVPVLAEEALATRKDH